MEKKTWVCKKCGYTATITNRSGEFRFQGVCPRCDSSVERPDLPPTERRLMTLQFNLATDRQKTLAKIYDILYEEEKYVHSIVKKTIKKLNIRLSADVIDEHAQTISLRLLTQFLEDPNYRIHSSWGNYMYYLVLKVVLSDIDIQNKEQTLDGEYIVEEGKTTDTQAVLKTDEYRLKSDILDAIAHFEPESILENLLFIRYINFMSSPVTNRKRQRQQLLHLQKTYPVFTKVTKYLQDYV